MKFNPAMFALSAANPDLLPLASAVHGRVEHSFKAGSGEELRGIVVDNARASAAYQKALTAIDDFSSKHQGVIAAIETEIDSELQREEEAEKILEAKKEQERKQRKLQSEERNARLKELQAKRKTFWGLTSKENKEYSKLDTASYIETYTDMAERQFNLMRPRPHKPSRRIKTLRRDIEEKNAVALTASNSLHLSREDVIEIYRIETDVDEWLSKKAGFECVIRRIQNET